MSEADFKKYRDITARFQNLEKARVRAEADLQNSQKQLDAALCELKQEFGLDSLEELREKYAAMQAENQALLTSLSQALDDAELRVREVMDSLK